MISNITDSTQAAQSAATPSSSSNQNSNVTAVNTPFGQLFLETIDGNPVVVGYRAPNSQTVNTDYAGASQGDIASMTASTPAKPANASTIASSTPTAATVNAAPLAAAAPQAAATPADAAPAAATPYIAGLAATDPNAVMSAQDAFGATPWMQNAGGNGPAGAFNLNPMYFASQQTAQTVATMLGGTVVPVDTFAQTAGNHFTQNQPNEMVKLPDGSLINAGLVAGFFTHGYQLSMIKTMIQNEITNVEAETKGVSTT